MKITITDSFGLPIVTEREQIARGLEQWADGILPNGNAIIFFHPGIAEVLREAAAAIRNGTI